MFVLVLVTAFSSAAVADEVEPLRDRVRRVVTGETARGQSGVLRDGGAPRVVVLDNYPGFEMVEVWATEEIPRLPVPRSEPTIAMDSFVPPSGGTRFRLTQIPPDTVFEQVREKGGAPAEFWKEYVAKAPGLAESHDGEHQMLRRTNTIDYVIVLEGEIWLELDDGSITELRQGDVVVQNASRYAWRNQSGAPCLLAEIMIGALGEHESADSGQSDGEEADSADWRSRIPDQSSRAKPPGSTKGTVKQ
jgi:hypothetical protein